MYQLSAVENSQNLNYNSLILHNFTKNNKTSGNYPKHVMDNCQTQTPLQLENPK